MVLNPTNAWAVSVEGVAGASATAGLQFEPSLNLQLAAGYTAYAHDTAPALQAPALRSAWGVTGFFRPIPASGFFFLDGQVGGTHTATGGTTTARLGASVQAHDVRLVPFVRLLRDAPAGSVATTRPFTGLDVFALPRPALGPVLGSVWMRGHVEQQLDGGLQAVQLVAARPLWSGRRSRPGCWGARGQQQRALGPERLVRGLAPRALRAGPRDGRLAFDRLAAAGAGVRLGEHRAGA